jgi:hypothetical protein
VCAQIFMREFARFSSLCSLRSGQKICGWGGKKAQHFPRGGGGGPPSKRGLLGQKMIYDLDLDLKRKEKN